MAIRGNKVLRGSAAEVWIDGVKAFILQKIELKVSVQRDDVQIGMDIDSKPTGLKGEGSIGIKKVYTTARPYVERLCNGEDVRVQIIAALKDPDATGGKTERWSADNVWFNTIPVVNWETSAVIQEDYEIGFTPGDLKNLDEITA